MVANVDLFTIATSGVNASNKLLETAGRNIANVNTEGYVRERTTFTGSILGSVGQGDTERVMNQFAQNQLRRDITAVGELESYTQKIGTIDNLLASEANSLSAGLSQFFSSIQTAADDPSNLASREAVLGEAEALLRRMTTTSDFMLAKEEELNLEFTSQINRANSLLENIGLLNEQIMVAQAGSQQQPSSLLNERDLAINDLAEIMSIEVRENANGSKAVNLSTGESLVLENGSFNFFELTSGADPTQKQLKLAYNVTANGDQASVRLTEDQLGGSLGGLFRFRNEVLAPTQRDIGQLAIAMADAANTQNRLGMDLDQQLGGDIFSLPTLSPRGYTENSDELLTMSAGFVPGKGSEMTDADIKVTVQSVDGSGQPLTVDVALLNGDGTPKLDGSGAKIEFSGITLNSPGPTELPGGLEIGFDNAAVYAQDDAFLIQPMKNAASEVAMGTLRAEDLAFASPVRAEPDSGNLGDGLVTEVSVTNTTTGGGAQGSAFDAAGGLSFSPDATFNAPVQVVFTSQTSFEVYDGTNTTPIVTVTGVTDYNNLLEQAAEAPGWPASFSAQDNYPGYDFSIQGEPVAGDKFDLSYNTNGINDNSNARKLADLQQDGLVQLSSQSSNQPRTFHESYSSLVGRIGEKAASADISLQAAETMQVQSQTWFDSVSGVSLDEEAANLVRYQQSYAAAARILSTAQELFDTILSAAR